MASIQRDTAKEAFWRKVLTRFAASGLSVREFCKCEQLTEGSFFFWRRTLGQRDRQQKSGKRCPPAVFVPAVVTEALPCSPSITLELTGGQVLRFPESISAERCNTCCGRAASMNAIKAIFRDGSFWPIDPVGLPEASRVVIEQRLVANTEGTPSLDEVYAVLNRRFHSGEGNLAEKHNEHQPCPPIYLDTVCLIAL